MYPNKKKYVLMFVAIGVFAGCDIEVPDSIKDYKASIDLQLKMNHLDSELGKSLSRLETARFYLNGKRGLLLNKKDVLFRENMGEDSEEQQQIRIRRKELEAKVEKCDLKMSEIHEVGAELFLQSDKANPELESIEASCQKFTKETVEILAEAKKLASQ